MITIHRIRIFPLILLLIAIISGCDEIEPTLPAANLILLPTDTRVTSVELSLHAEPNGRPWTISVERNGIARWTIGPSSAMSFDTLITDVFLNPATSYSYKAYYLQNSKKVDSSSTAAITTMDTSNHNFTWQLYTFGHIGSEIRDVAIINDTCVWVVGRIAKENPDSSGDEIEYGASVWNGEVWTDILVPWSDYGSTVPSPGEVNAILAFSGDDIYASTFGSRIHWDGLEWTQVAQFVETLPFTHQIYSMWGDRPTNIYCGGRNGAIYHVEGSSWTMIPTGTTLDLQDIWGSVNPRSGSVEILGIAADPFSSNDRLILSISPTHAEGIGDDGITTGLGSTWFVPDRDYFVCGRRIFETRSIGPPISWSTNIGSAHTLTYNEHIRGTDINDIVVVGDGGTILHYDGNYWRNFDAFTSLSAGKYYRVAISSHLVVAVGFNDDIGVVMIGRR